MKNIRLLSGLLAALVLAGLIGTHTFLSADQEHLVLTEFPLQGDPTAAQELTIRTRAVEDCLFWDTVFTPGTDPEAAFRFSPEHPRREPDRHYELSMSLHVPTSRGSTYLYGTPAPGVDAIQAELSARTAPGGTEAMTVRLADYMDFYPADFYLSLPIRPYQESSRSPQQENEDFWKQFCETFRFPVHPDHLAAVALQKDSRGRPVELALECVPGHSITADLPCLTIADGIWFVPELRDESDALLDYSHTPGYGVYYLACPEGPLTMDNLHLVCPLEPDQRVVHMELTPDERTALITITGPGGCTVEVLSADDPDWRQSLPLSGCPDPWSLIVENDLLAALDPAGALRLYTRTDAGYEFQFAAPLPDSALFTPIPPDIDFAPRTKPAAAAFDGTRLALAFRPICTLENVTGRDLAHGFALLIAEETAPGLGKLSYAGLYASSLDQGAVHFSGDRIEAPLSLSWD